MMVDEEVRDDGVDGKDDAMDFECELHSSLKTIGELV
jgi:hypothetical protein